MATERLPAHPEHELHLCLLRRRGVCLRLAAILLVMLLFASVVHLSILASMRIDVVLVFYQAMLLSGVLSLVPISILWFLDRRERESPWIFAVAVLWGGSISTAVALPFNSVFLVLADNWLAQNPALREMLGPDAALLLTAPIAAPVTEEIVKALGVLLLFWLLRAEFDNMRDGLIYGALIGVGFNWYEAALYVAQGYVEQGTPPFGLQLGARYALFGLGGHALLTGMFGAFLGFAMQTTRTWLKILAPAAGLLLAMLAHIINNVLPLFATLLGAQDGVSPQPREAIPHLGFLDAFLSASLLQLTIFLPFILIMAAVLWRSGVWERRVIREELADEIGKAVDAEEYRAVVADRMFRTRRIDSLNPARSAALVNAQHELAFRKRRVRREGGDPDRDPLALGWRENIRKLREAA